MSHLLQEASPPLSWINLSSVLSEHLNTPSFLAFTTHCTAMICCHTCSSHGIETSVKMMSMFYLQSNTYRAFFFFVCHCCECNWGNIKLWWNVLFPNHSDSHSFDRVTRKTKLQEASGFLPTWYLSFYLVPPGIIGVVDRNCLSQFGLL